MVDRSPELYFLSCFYANPYVCFNYSSLSSSLLFVGGSANCEMNMNRYIGLVMLFDAGSE